MKLYHGSTFIVDKPLVSYGRENLDFGKGFYTTSMQSQAEKWVQRFISLGKKGIILIRLQIPLSTPLFRLMVILNGWAPGLTSNSLRFS